MLLFNLQQQDIDDALALLSSANLMIAASQATRVAQLQAVFANARASTALEELKARCEALEHEVQACLRVRDNALLEAGVVKRRVDQLEHELECCDSTHCTDVYDRKCGQVDAARAQEASTPLVV